MPIAKPDLTLEGEYQQMALELDLPEVEAELDGVSTEEAKLRREAARVALMQMRGEQDEPGWFEDFLGLIDGGWPWRQAAYIAWASMPREQRQPATQDELAVRFLGLNSDRAISTWRRKNPAIDQTIAMLQSAPLWKHRADAFDNLVKGMKNSGEDYKFFNHLKLFLEMTGDYIPMHQLAAELRKRFQGDLSDLSEEELVTLAKEVGDAVRERGKADDEEEAEE